MGVPKLIVMTLKFDGSSSTSLLWSLTCDIRKKTHKAPYFLSLASRFEKCELTNAAGWGFEDLNADKKWSCVLWTGHCNACVRDQCFHWSSLFKWLCMLWNGAVLYKLFSQINIFELDIILLPLDMCRSINIILKDAPLLNSTVDALYTIYIMNFQLNQPTRCSNFSSLFLVV